MTKPKKTEEGKVGIEDLRKRKKKRHGVKILNAAKRYEHQHVVLIRT